METQIFYDTPKKHYIGYLIEFLFRRYIYVKIIILKFIAILYHLFFISGKFKTHVKLYNDSTKTQNAWAGGGVATPRKLT